MSRITLRSIECGMLAGLVATTVLSLIILLKQLFGVMPQLDLMAVLAHALGYRSAGVGWLANYVVGVFLWGPVFAWADAKMFFAHPLNGLVFASVVWLGVMLIIMPLAGEGLFGLNLGLVVPTLTLFLHWFYGIALGATYARLMHLPTHPDSGLHTPRHA